MFYTLYQVGPSFFKMSSVSSKHSLQFYYVNIILPDINKGCNSVDFVEARTNPLADTKDTGNCNFPLPSSILFTKAGQRVFFELFF